MKSTDFAKKLKENSQRVTRVRVGILELLDKANVPLSVVSIMESLKENELSPDRVTVYRELSFLKEQKMITEVEFGEGKKRYEILGKHHHHIICVNCEKIEDIPLERDLDKEEVEIAKSKGFKIINHSLEFFGLCSDCQ